MNIIDELKMIIFIQVLSFCVILSFALFIPLTMTFVFTIQGIMFVCTVVSSPLAKLFNWWMCL